MNGDAPTELIEQTLRRIIDNDVDASLRDAFHSAIPSLVTRTREQLGSSTNLEFAARETINMRITAIKRQVAALSMG